MDPPKSPMPDFVLRRMLGLSDELHRFNGVIHTVLHASHANSDVIGALLWAAAQSCDSLNKLAFYGKQRDCYVLARCAWETLLNAAYVFVAGDAVAEKARKHALQKGYRDLSRSIKVGSAEVGISSSAKIDISAFPKLGEALRDYTNKRGQEVRDWIEESVDDRLGAIAAASSEKSVVGLSFARLAIYRHASDIVHGTFYGATYALGLTVSQQPPDDEAALVKNHADNLVMLLLLLQYSVHDVIGLMAKEFSFESIADASHSALMDLDPEKLFNAGR